jgi:CPA2 family monovalent cation:H+ antiporter-2
MIDPTISNWIVDLMVILAAGLLSGLLCKWRGISLLVGYLVVGAVIGGGGLRLVTQEHHEIEWVARTGALLLLFSIGMEFSLGELRRLRRYFFIGGSVQMLLAALPLIVMLPLLGWNWRAALMIGAATSLSSTVLVFKTLSEYGQLDTPHGRRAIAVLLFQDVALVPLMLLMPMLTGEGSTGLLSIAVLAASTTMFLFGVYSTRYCITTFVAPILLHMRSVELLVLFSLTVLGLGVGGAHFAGLPPALGALAAGVVLGGNRLSAQVDAMILPFRESFAAVFFVSLGTLLRPAIFLEQPLLLLAGLLGTLAMKTIAGGAALRCTGLTWRASLGMGLGLAQMGEFSFVLFSEAMRLGLVSTQDYNRMLFIALGTLIATPELLRLGLRWASVPVEVAGGEHDDGQRLEFPGGMAVIIGGGRLGRHAAEDLRQKECEVRVIDTSPVNLHRFAQAGFQTASGDARSAAVLKRVSIEQAGLVMIFVSQDEIALQIVHAVRDLNANASLLVRCRYHDNIETLKQGGCNAVICDETEATAAISRLQAFSSNLTVQATQPGKENMVTTE